MAKKQIKNFTLAEWLEAHVRLEARMAALEEWKKSDASLLEQAIRAQAEFIALMKKAESHESRIANLEQVTAIVSPPPLKPTPPKVHDGFELTGEFREPNPNEWYAREPDHLEILNTSQSQTIKFGPRWILRRVEPRKIGIIFTAGEWNDISVELRKSGMSAASAHIQEQLEAAKK